MVEIDAQTARRWVEGGEALLVDVREAGEYAARHVPGSLHVPLGTLSQAALPAQGRKVVLLCASGMRSARGCATLRPGVEAYSLKGGLSAWASAGGATQADAKAAARQGKLLAGLLTLVGLGLAVQVHPGFVVLAAMAGARLFTLMLAPATPGCTSGSAGQTACTTPDARGKTSACGGCGARNLQG